MDPERWKRVDEIFHLHWIAKCLQEQPFYSEECKGDDSLLEEVESLLDNLDEQNSLFDSPPTDLTAEFLEKQSSYKGSIAQYQIIREIGSGGIGYIYLINLFCKNYSDLLFIIWFLTLAEAFGTFYTAKRILC